ncbi:hypothetical protein [Massilia sp. PAMC28688]|uniref:hypothetical protein n=1 Tax=Massilia sp. PAMC28688 TaxID=2861283 RepID=UPI001E625565|nr:hypothetical protein [Massilia sp. PAMC28688]
MRTQIMKISAICALLLAAGCQSTGDTNSAAQNETPPPSNPQFASQMQKFEKQFPNAKNMKYEDESLAYNNANKLDMKGNCHGMSIYPVTILLTLDASGRVTDTMTDVQNKKAECFRKAYANVQFPKPPVAPYFKPIRLK